RLSCRSIIQPCAFATNGFFAIMNFDRISVAYRPPFAFDAPCYVEERRPGESILDIIQSLKFLPPSFARHGYVCINGEIVPRPMWAYVRPKPPRPELHVAVTLHIALRDGGAGGRSTAKTIGALVAAVALIVVTAGISAGAVPALLGAETVG